jgi:hypothetical protein
MQVDLDEGVGAFASINAMQGYRPNPVAQHALQAIRAQRSSKSFPAAPAVEPPTYVENASDYAGTYHSSGGKTLEFVAGKDHLSVRHESQSIALEAEGYGAFLAPHPDFSRFVLVFGRADAKDPKSPVVEVGWGNDWYTKTEYKGAKTFDYPQEWNAYLGHYRNENNWVGSIRITLRKGVLLADGTTRLEEEKPGLFRMRSDEADTEWIQFHDIVNGLAQRIKLSGEDLWRVLAP